MKNNLFALMIASSFFLNSVHADEVKQAGEKEAAYGKPGDSARVTRTVGVEMNDSMRYKPAHIDVKRGETIKFVVSNTGKLQHEFVLGQIKSLKKHAEMMRKMPGMEHAEPNQLVVGPGQTGELVWQFTKPGKFDFACLIPGHFEAGMKGKVAVKK